MNNYLTAMQDIKNLINELKLSDNTMEYSKYFDLIKSAINYTNDYSKPISKIQYRGGNEGFILDITSRILRNLRNEQCIDDKNEINVKYENELRKITFFMVLNSEATYPYDLQKDNTIACVLNVMPQLPKCLLINCIWGLGLETFFYEIVAYTPHWLSMEFYSQINVFLPHVDQYKGLLSAKHLINAIYMNIVQSEFKIIEANERKQIYDKFAEIIYEILRQYFSPEYSEIDEMDKAKRNDFPKRLGYVIKYLTEIIIQCVDLYKNKPKFEIADKFRIYSIMSEVCQRVDNHSEIYSDEMNAALLKITNILLNSLKLNGMKVTLDNFMEWVEIDIDDERTLQQDIGENLYQIVGIINIEQAFDKKIIPVLEGIAIKPKTLGEQLQAATLGEIMKKIESLPNDDATKSQWMAEFIRRGDLVLDNIECLETIEQNIHVISASAIKCLLKAFENDELEYEEKIKQIVIKSFEALTDDDESLDVLNALIENYGTDVDIFQPGDPHSFTHQLTELFNKIHTGTTISYGMYKIFLLMNPQKFYGYIWENLFSLSETTDNCQLIFHEIFLKTKQIYESNYFEENLNNIFNKNFQNISNHFVELIFQFYANNFLDRNYFVKDILLKRLIILLQATDCSAPENDNLVQFNLLLTILQKIFNANDRDSTEFEIVPMLVIFGGIMEKFRWDLVKYNKKFEEILEKTINMVGVLQKHLLGKQKISREKLAWIKAKLTDYKRINLFYFQDLLSTEKLNLYTFLGGDNISGSNDIIGFLCENLVRCTYTEMEILSQNKILQSHFGNAILLISIIVKKSNNSMASVSCLQQIFLNYIKILNNSIGEIADADSQTRVFNEICNILNGLPASIYDSLFLYAHPILLNFYEQATNLNEVAAVATNRAFKLKKKLEKMPDCESKKILLNKI